MTGVKYIWLVWAALLLGIAAFSFWNKPGLSENYGFPVNIYYTGIALSIFLFCLFIFVNNKGYCISFASVSFTGNNLIDELMNQNLKTNINEWVVVIFTIFIGLHVYCGWKAVFSGNFRGLFKNNINAFSSYNNSSFKVDNREQEK